MKKQKRMGRPLKTEGRPRAKIRSFRLRPDLDQKLIRAAGKAGRTVSDEIEYRLEQSFSAPDALVATATAAFGEMIRTGKVTIVAPDKESTGGKK
jgi:hypothetical protein